MGNDGGSIPDRRDLVRTKAKAEQADKANQTRARWFFCALSKKPLQEPIVSCALGKLYNKDAVLEYLLDKSAYGEGEEVCGHIKSLKDVKQLKLTPNPTPAPDQLDSDTQRAPFICPLTLKEMNGAIPFLYIATCGCVISKAGLKVLAGSGEASTPPSDSQAEDAGPPQQFELCPQCGTKYDRKTDVRTINPDKETEDVMRAAMEARKKEKSSKNKSKTKKRKADEAEPEKEKDAIEAKKARPAPSLNPSIAAASKAVTESLAAEEAKRKAGMSDAVRSLYAGKGGEQKETFMTRTFNRYA